MYYNNNELTNIFKKSKKINKQINDFKKIYIS